MLIHRFLGYTALTVLRLGQYGRKVLPRHTILPQEAADAIYWCSIPFALFLIGLALYFWFFALIPWLTSAKAHVYRKCYIWSGHFSSLLTRLVAHSQPSWLMADDLPKQ